MKNLIPALVEEGEVEKNAATIPAAPRHTATALAPVAPAPSPHARTPTAPPTAAHTLYIIPAQPYGARRPRNERKILFVWAYGKVTEVQSDYDLCELGAEDWLLPRHRISQANLDVGRVPATAHGT